MGYSPTEYAEFTEPPAEMSSHGFLLRRVWHLAIPTPPAMGYSPTEYAEFTEPPTEMSSHGFHRSAQILRVRCSPTEFTEYTEFGSVGMAGMPYPPTSVLICAICGRLFSARSFCAFRAFCGNIFSSTDFSLGGYGILPYPRRLLWDILPQNTPNSQNLLLRRASHGFHRFTQILRVRCSPTEFTEYTEFGSVGMAGMPYPPNLCASMSSVGGSSLPEVSVSSVSSVGVLSLQEVLCIRCIPWEFLHRLFGWCSGDSCTPWAGSVGMAGMPYPPNLCASMSSVGGSSLQGVLCIRCIPWELLHRLFGWCS